MTVTIKPLTERDFFAWYGLFSAYTESLGLEPTDEQTMRVWTALHSDEADGVLAVDTVAGTVGFAHFSVFSRLLQGDTGLALEDVYVAPEMRERGVATALIEHVRTRAEEEHRSVVRWVTRPEDVAAKALYERFRAATGDWALYDLNVG